MDYYFAFLFRGVIWTFFHINAPLRRSLGVVAYSMLKNKSPIFLILLALLAWTPMARAQVTVTGVTDLAYYNDTVTFNITNEAGYTYTATLDGVAINPAVAYTENRFGYHELFVSRTNGGAAQTKLVKFIVKDVARGGSSTTYPEAGLGRWTPRRSVDAPDAVLDAAQLQIVSPSVVPVNFALPVVVKLTDGAGKGLRVMGTANVSGGTAGQFRIYRGGGSGVLSSGTAAGNQAIQVKVGTRSISKPLTTVASPAWQAITGAAGGQSFPAGSFIDMTGNVTVAAGTTLTIGAGSVVRCAQGVEMDVQGSLIMNGTEAEPIVFGPATGAVWGGLWVHAVGSRLEARFTILTGGGNNPSWISQKGMHSHRSNQPLVTWSDSATGFLEDCAIIGNPKGQTLHGEASLVAGNPFTIRRTVLQRSISGGQMHNVNLVWDQNYLLEMPADETAYTAADATDDYDGLYCDGGQTTVTGSVFGWVKDDGMDAGSGNTSNVSVSDSWFESCYHEGMAWSEGGTRTVRDTVTMNNGQGLECGFTGQGAGTPSVDAQRVYITGNLNGIRYGDNYNWDYSGKFDVHDSLSLFNGDDVFGRHWGNLVGSTTVDWAYIGNVRTANAYMHLEALPALSLGATIVSTAQAEHATLPVWDGVTPAQLAKLTPFLALPALASGVGFGQEDRQFTRVAYTVGGKVSLRLDRPTNVARSVPWKITGKVSISATTETELATGALIFIAGQESAQLALPTLTGAAGYSFLCLTLLPGPSVEVTGNSTITWGDLALPTPPTPPTPITLIPRAATGWKYLAQATAAATNWATPAFVDTAWPTGSAPLQTQEAALGGTAVPGNPANLNGTAPRPYNTVYFRKTFTVADRTAFSSLAINCMVDDGVVLHLNGNFLTSFNMPAGTIGYNTAASGTPANEDTFNPLANLSITNLVNGVNVLGVEVHQSPISATTLLTSSSDMRLDLDLLGVLPSPTLAPASNTTVMGGKLQLFWQDPALLLQCSQNLNSDWVNLPAARSPYAISPQESRMFFRLFKP
jgi:hypothetical protein